jgi:hypothetical protein
MEAGLRGAAEAEEGYRDSMRNAVMEVHMATSSESNPDTETKRHAVLVAQQQADQAKHALADFKHSVIAYKHAGQEQKSKANELIARAHQGVSVNAADLRRLQDELILAQEREV